MQDKALERRLTEPISSLFWIYLCWQGNVGNISSDRKSKYVSRAALKYVGVRREDEYPRWSRPYLVNGWNNSKNTERAREVFLFVFKC